MGVTKSTYKRTRNVKKGDDEGYWTYATPAKAKPDVLPDYFYTSEHSAARGGKVHSTFCRTVTLMNNIDQLDPMSVEKVDFDKNECKHCK